MDYNMRTLEEIKQYLSKRYCKEETDPIAIQKIIEDIHSTKIVINHYSPELEPVTFNEFKTWVTDFNPQPGNILYYRIENSFKTFIVKEVLYGGYKSLASYSSNKKLETTEEWIEANDYIRFATQGEKLSLTKKLKENNYYWLKSKNIILQPTKPYSGSITKYISSETQGTCIFDKISSTGDVICFATLDDNDNLEFQYPVIMKNANNIIFYEATKNEQEYIRLKLNNANKQWDPKLLRIDDVDPKFIKDISYHYLNDTFNICTTTSRCNKRDADKFRAGNYMIDFDDVVELQEAIHSKIKEIKSRKRNN